MQASNYQDAITILNNRASEWIFMKQKLTELKAESHISTNIFRNSTTLLSIINRRSRQKISKYIENMSNTFNQFELSDIYRLLQQRTAVYTFISSSCVIFTKINHTLSPKTGLPINLKDFKSCSPGSFSTIELN